MYALRSPKWLPALLLILALAIAFATATAFAQDTEPVQEAAEAVAADAPAADAAPAAVAEGAVSMGVFTANNLWMMLCTGLVFIMHLGFATLESGLTQQKNTVNIL
ncbi:MAG: ammonium transporter, partial [Candidatus Tectomicrobia bacterium]|nr:ammonium transporter [Candidatus Tectomicrobia bacterium]